MDKEMIAQIIIGYLPASIVADWSRIASLPELKSVERLVHGRRLESLSLRYPGGCRRRADILLTVHAKMQQLEH